MEKKEAVKSKNALTIMIIRLVFKIMNDLVRSKIIYHQLCVECVGRG